MKKPTIKNIVGLVVGNQPTGYRFSRFQQVNYTLSFFYLSILNYFGLYCAFNQTCFASAFRLDLARTQEQLRIKLIGIQFLDKQYTPQ